MHQLGPPGFVSHARSLASAVQAGFIYRSDAIAELCDEYGITGTEAEDVLDRMSQEDREIQEQEEWDVANNISDHKEIGAEKFQVHHFKGVPGYHNHLGEWISNREFEEWWSVSLPHQCEDWDILYCSDHAEAVRKLQLFITDANKALEQLQLMR